MDPTFPSLPHLTSLRLSDVNVHNLFGLLSQCANTLKELALHQIRSKPPVTFFPIPPGGGQKDLPPTLYLPYLAELELCGYATALFLWTAPTLSTQSFLIEALSLKKVDFGDQHRLDYELQMEDGLDDWDAYHFLTNENLSTCLRDSPSLVSLKLAGTNATPTMLYAALPNAGPNLSKLILGDNATDDLVNRLHVLCPNLKYLDVQGLHGGHLQVTLPALARLASRLRNSGSAQLPRWLSVWKLTLVTGGSKFLSVMPWRCWLTLDSPSGLSCRRALQPPDYLDPPRRAPHAPPIPLLDPSTTPHQYPHAQRPTQRPRLCRRQARSGRPRFGASHCRGDGQWEWQVEGGGGGGETGGAARDCG